MSYNELSERYKALRLEKGLSIRELALLINCNEKTISFYENGEREISIGTLQKYADFFGVSTDYLLGRTKTKNPNKRSRKGFDYECAYVLTGLTEDAFLSLMNARFNDQVCYHYGLKGLNDILSKPENGFSILCSIFEYIHSHEIAKGKIPDFARKDIWPMELVDRSIIISLIKESLEKLRKEYEKENHDFDVKEEIRRTKEYLKALEKIAQNDE